MHVERRTRPVLLSLLCLTWMGPLACKRASETPAEGARDTQAGNPAPAPAQATSLPVQVLPGLEMISKPEEAAAALRREWPQTYALMEGRLPQKKARELRRCTDIEGVDANDVDVVTQQETEIVQLQFLQCRVLKALTTARPSRTSQVREILKLKSPGDVLPAALAPEFGEAAPDKARERQGKSWSATEPALHFEPREGERNAFSLEVTGQDTFGLLEWWATGDFNGDGQEDVIAYRAMSPRGGSLTDIAAFVLTRSQPQGVLQILEHWR
ncbi:hypothetical protein CYFUS_007807 [Cystobacter fuscus]|uniref:Uncharacterized protein n=1 Tax=Cystobacter fuscus TaxID=43 RepID=A0A250JEK5_9BACT|nr:hypothetical protein [Cystobacter fuscus]ATB42329.1 hypothetical protein CYFUS_007807 [Cystobacter fuscus]